MFSLFLGIVTGSRLKARSKTIHEHVCSTKRHKITHEPWAKSTEYHSYLYIHLHADACVFYASLWKMHKNQTRAQRSIVTFSCVACDHSDLATEHLPKYLFYYKKHIERSDKSERTLFHSISLSHFDAIVAYLLKILKWHAIALYALVSFHDHILSLIRKPNLQIL